MSEPLFLQSVMQEKMMSLATTSQVKKSENTGPFQPTQMGFQRSLMGATREQT